MKETLQMQCEQVSELLPNIVEDGVEASAEVRAHIESCLRCQAEVAHYKKLLRSLHALRVEVLEPAPGMLAAILARLEAAGERSAVRSILTSKKTAYASGVAVATTAGVIGAVIFANRTRKARNVA
jgi:anti-sigma factor RsiW